MHVSSRIPRRTRHFQFSLRAMLLTTAGFALVLGLIVSVKSFRDWLSAEALRGQIASIQASGDPVSFAELAGEPVPRAVNAASYLERAEEGLSGDVKLAWFHDFTRFRSFSQKPYAEFEPYGATDF